MKAVWTKGNVLQLTHCPELVKFTSDHFDYEDEHYRVICEGLILNDLPLREQHPQETLPQIILTTFRDGGMEAVLNLLRGSYVIAIEDKAADEAYIANDILSKKPLYVLLEEELLIAGTSYLDVVALAKEKNVHLEIDAAGANEMIHLCSFIGEDTYLKQIRFLKQLSYLKITKDSASIATYEYQAKAPVPDTDEELIERIDQLFTDACRMAARKNQAAGYRPVFSLSAGMDSRVSFLKTMPLFEPNVETPLCFTYGAAGCMDIQIASQLAGDQHCDLIIHEINSSRFIQDREQVIDQSEGQMYYAGTTGLNRLLKAMDTSRIGMVITGLGGGEIMGDLWKPSTGADDDRKLFDSFLSPILPDAEQRTERIQQLMQTYASYNEFVSFQDIRTCHNFAYTSRLAFGTFSPFLYEDFFMLMLKIPQEKKAFRRLYAQWYLKHIGDPHPTSCFQGPVKVTRPTAPDQLFKGVLRRAKRMLRIQSKWDMNPIALWVKENEENRVFMDESLKADLNVLREKQPQLAQMLEAAYTDADADTKLRILTASEMYKRIL